MDIADHSALQQELFFRTRDTIRVLQGISDQHTSKHCGPCHSALFSPSGTFLAVVDPAGLSVKSTTDYGEVHRIRREKVQCLDFSPCNRYLVSWEKFKGSDNLFVWELATGRPLYSFEQQKYTKEQWPTIRWSRDGAHFGRKVNYSVVVYAVPNPEPIYSIDQELLSDFSIAPAANLRLLVFKSETRESPGLVSLYEGQTKAFEKELEKSQDAKVLWNCRGNAAVIWCSSSVDTSGRNYYGEHALKYICGTKVKHIKTPEGPVHDLAWSPKGDEFIVISGFMPPHSQLFNLDGNKVQDIANTHRNTVKWNPFGSLFLIGGFGNLQGELEVWERESMRVVGSVRSELAVTLEWTPCGRMFVTATINPRLRVDNGYKVYKYSGELLYSYRAEGELWEVKCRPFPGKFQSRALSASPAPRAAPPQKKAYRPPGSSSNFAERFRAMKSGAPDVPEKAKTKQEVEDYIPGYVPDKKKRKKKKKEAKVPEA